jgi:hypothetical protein
MNESQTVIAVPDTTEIRGDATVWLGEATRHAVVDQETLDQASTLLKSIKAARKKIDEKLGPIIKSAHDAHGRLVALRRELEEPFEKAETLLKRSAAKYLDAERDRQAAERKRVEDENRKRAEEERLARAAQLEGQGRLAEAEAEIEVPIEIESAMQEAPRAAGISSNARWSARVDSPLVLVRWIAQHPEYINLVAPNMVALNELARVQKHAFNVPGVSAHKETSISVR